MSEMGKLGARLLGIILGGACSWGASSATAQITPDRTLPNNSSVTINGSVFNITGGTQAGRNLFHSFQQFSVPTGSTASFNNGLDIQNIISRVTGGEVSNIDGLIKALGTANLFFLNPNGIVFGKNASLNIGGSFVATTANAIQFGNQGIFSATTQDALSPLLTVNPTALFYNQIVRSASIQNSSTSPASTIPTGGNSSGLRVPDGKSLLLVGGDITMDGGRLRAYGGQVELGGLAAPGTVGLGVNGNNLSLSFPTESARATVSLINGASVNVSAANGGSITVNASNLNITSGSQLNADIGPRFGSVGAKLGNITLNATGEIKIDGNGSGITNNVQQQAVDNGGDIKITTDQLSLSNDAQIQASTFGAGYAGYVNINATKSISLTNDAAIEASTFGPGNAGYVNINATKSISLTNDAAIEASTFGPGNAGDVVIQTHSFSLTNAAKVATSSQPIQGSTPERVKNGGQVTASSLVSGDAGNIQVTARFIQLNNQASIQAAAVFGNGGNININAQDLLLLTGNSIISASSGLARTDRNGTNSITAIAPSGFISNFTRAVGTGGDGGTIRINNSSGFIVATPNDDNEITVDTFNGSGGLISVNTLGISGFTGLIFPSPELFVRPIRYS